MEKTNLPKIQEKNENTLKFLQNKSNRNSKYKKKWKPYKDLTYIERKNLSDREAIKDHYKQVLKNNPKLLKSLDYSKKGINLINKPNTPHNTTQYLSSNFSHGRNEKVATVVSEFIPLYDDLVEKDITDDYLADDYCIPGGSMKDEIPFTQDENINENCINAPKMRKYSNLEEVDEEESEIDKYRKIIEEQNKMINLLNNKLQTLESEGKLGNEYKILPIGDKTNLNNT